ncbi:MAG: transposase [Candidatus Omnitrophota bacterium]
MARQYRILGEGAFYHITSRGDGRRNIYERERDHKKFLEYILRAKEKYHFRLYAYVLMPNHYHLLIQTLQANLPKIMHYINSVYTTYYNKVNRNVGHVFQGRYKSLIVDADTYFKELTRYIHLNPVRAKIADKPEEYEWSSYKGYISRKGDGFIDRGDIDKVLGMSIEEYKKYVYRGIGKEEKIFKDVYAGSMLGGVDFIKEKIKGLKIQVESKNIAYNEKYIEEIEEERILEYIIREHRIGREELLKSKNKQNQAKKNSIYLLKRLTGKTNKEIGEMFDISHTAVSKAYSSMEQEMKESRKVKRKIEGQISHFKP